MTIDNVHQFSNWHVSCWNPQQISANTTYKLAVAPSLAFTDCAPTEGLTMACHGMSHQHCANPHSRPLCSAYNAYNKINTAMVDICNRIQETQQRRGQTQTHLQPGFLQISELRYQQENPKETEYDSKYLRPVQHRKPQWWHCWHCWTCSCCWSCLHCPTQYCNSTRKYRYVNTTFKKTSMCIDMYRFKMYIDVHIINSPTAHFIPLFPSLFIFFYLFLCIFLVLSLSISSYLVVPLSLFRSYIRSFYLFFSLLALSFSIFSCMFLFLSLSISACHFQFLLFSVCFFLSLCISCCIICIVVTCHLERLWTRSTTSNWPCSCFGLAKAPAASDERLEKHHRTNSKAFLVHTCCCARHLDKELLVDAGCIIASQIDRNR